MRAFGVLFVELKTEFRLSTSVLSLVVALHTALFTIGGLFALTYGVRYLTVRQCVFIGAILAVLSFVFSSLAKNGLILFVSYGFLLGLSFSFVIGPSTLLVSLYFKKRRNLTTWCLQMSPSIGALLYAPLLRGLIDKYQLKGCLLIMAAILGHFLLASVLMRPPELYKKWQKLKQKIEKNRMKTSLLGKDGYPLEPFRARSPTSDSTFSPLARQAMLQRMKSRNDEDEDNPTPAHSDKSKKKLIEPEQKDTDDIEQRGHDIHPTKQRTENWRQKALYASYDFGISAPFLEQRYNSSRKRTESEKSNKSDRSDNSFLSENALVKGCMDVTLKQCFKTSVLCNPSFVLFCVGFTLGIPTATAVLFLPDVGISNHLDNTQSASLVSVYMIGEIMGQITAVLLSYKRIDNFIIVIISLIAIGIIYNLLRYFFNFTLLIIFSLVIGICSGPFQSLHANIIRRCVKPEEVSSGMCLLHFAQGLSWTVVIAITGFLRDVTGSYNMSFTVLGSLGVASSIFIAASRLCLRKHREVYHPETGELENQEIIIK